MYYDFVFVPPHLTPPRKRRTVRKRCVCVYVSAHDTKKNAGGANERTFGMKEIMKDTATPGVLQHTAQNTHTNHHTTDGRRSSDGDRTQPQPAPANTSQRKKRRERGDSTFHTRRLRVLNSRGQYTHSEQPVRRRGYCMHNLVAQRHRTAVVAVSVVAWRRRRRPARAALLTVTAMFAYTVAARCRVNASTRAHRTADGGSSRRDKLCADRASCCTKHFMFALKAAPPAERA